MTAELRYRDFEVRPDERRLIVSGKPVPIGARAYDLLMALIERSDRVVGKHELLDVVWPKLVVEENNLQVHIHALRKLLGPATITTVPGRGYRFTAESAVPDVGKSVLRPGPGNQPAASSPEGNLPAFIPEIYGRDDDVLAILTLLETERLVTITGAGGIGKTRVAQAVAHRLRDRFPQGAWMIELASVQDEERLVFLIAQTLGAALSGRRPALDELADALRSQSLLLVLDNCEHLADSVSRLVLRILSGAPSVLVLATSQELMRIAEEHVYKLSSLAIPSAPSLANACDFGAVRLFVERARALDRSFDLNERNVDTVVDICAKLEGIALAIELAAARVPMLGVNGIHDRLGERLRVLTGGARVSLRRHQTLRAALDWSHQLLDANEATVFRRLAVFSGGFTVEGAQLVASDGEIDEWSLLDILGALVDKSLVLVEGGDRPRYRLLETTCAYALERLAEAGETNGLLRRHAEATRTICERAAEQRDSDCFWAEMNNLRAAYAWAVGRDGDAVIAVALAATSAMVLAVSGLASEAMTRMLEVEPLVTAATPPALAALYWQWLGRGGVEGRLSTSRCIEALQRAQSMFRALGNERHVHACMRMRAEAMLASNDLPGAEAALRDAESMEEQGRWPLADRMRRLRVQGLLHRATGRYAESLATSQRAYDMADSAGIERYVLILLADMARVHLQMDHPGEASEQFRLLAERAGSRRSHGLTLAQALAGLTAALILQPRLDEAVAVGVRNLPLLRRSGIFLAHCDIYAWLAACKGLTVAAAHLLGAADAFHRASETSRDEIKVRAREDVMRMLGVVSAAGQIKAWLAEGAASTEDAAAAAFEAAFIPERLDSYAPGATIEHERRDRVALLRAR